MCGRVVKNGFKLLYAADVLEMAMSTRLSSIIKCNMCTTHGLNFSILQLFCVLIKFYIVLIGKPFSKQHIIFVTLHNVIARFPIELYVICGRFTIGFSGRAHMVTLILILAHIYCCPCSNLAPW